MTTEETKALVEAFEDAARANHGNGIAAEERDALLAAINSAVLAAREEGQRDGEDRYVERHGSCPHKVARRKAEAACANAVAALSSAVEAARAEGERRLSARVEALEGALRVLLQMEVNGVLDIRVMQRARAALRDEESAP